MKQGYSLQPRISLFGGLRNWITLSVFLERSATYLLFIFQLFFSDEGSYGRTVRVFEVVLHKTILLFIMAKLLRAS